MESLKKNKTLIIIFGISCIAFLIYQFGGLFNPVETPAGSSPADDAATVQILQLLSQMQQAKIDSDLLSSTAWTNLVDYSVPLPTDVPGRPELFSGPLQSTPGR